MRWNELNAPLQRNVNQHEVGNVALSLLSDLGSAITGQVLHVDCGYSSIAMINTEKAGEIAEVLKEF